MKNQILEQLSEQGHGFTVYEAYNDGEENIEITFPTYSASWERSTKLYLMTSYGFSQEQAQAFFDWYHNALEVGGLEFDSIEPFQEEVLWFLEGWNQEQIGEIARGIINIQNVDAQKLPHHPKLKNYCWSEK